MVHGTVLVRSILCEIKFLKFTRKFFPWQIRYELIVAKWPLWKSNANMVTVSEYAIMILYENGGQTRHCIIILFCTTTKCSQGNA